MVDLIDHIPLKSTRPRCGDREITLLNMVDPIDHIPRKSTRPRCGDREITLLNMVDPIDHICHQLTLLRGKRKVIASISQGF
jgi:hypothetical protein